MSDKQTFRAYVDDFNYNWITGGESFYAIFAQDSDSTHRLTITAEPIEPETPKREWIPITESTPKLLLNTKYWVTWSNDNHVCAQTADGRGFARNDKAYMLREEGDPEPQPYIPPTKKEADPVEEMKKAGWVMQSGYPHSETPSGSEVIKMYRLKPAPAISLEQRLTNLRAHLQGKHSYGGGYLERIEEGEIE